VQPSWFKQFVSQVPIDRTCVIDGAAIHYLHWPNPGKPGLMFVHGHAAHAHWWDFIAPAVSEGYDVVAIDLSGSGDSDHRDSYSAGLFAKEIVGCIEDARLASPVVVGHSFGGSMTRIAAHLYPNKIKGIVIVDSVIPSQAGPRTPPPMPRSKTRYYPNLTEAKRRFRLRPPQPCDNDFILDHIAAHSVLETEQGYRFKLDSAVFAKMQVTEQFPPASDMITAMKMPVGFIYGVKSRFFTPEIVAELSMVVDERLTRSVPDAYHHVFLDQPLLFIERLKELLKLMTVVRRHRW